MNGNSQLLEDLSEDIREMTRNIRRRYVLYCLSERDGPVDLFDLVERVASWESGCEPDQLDRRTIKSVYSSLYQSHLPLLEERNLVSFDRQRKMVSPTDRTERVTIEFRTDPSPLDRQSMATIVGVSIAAASVSLWGGQFFPTAISGLVGITLLAVVLVSSYAAYRSARQSTTSIAPDFTLTVDDTRR
ncbi:hypothetical protein ACFQMM_06325 [Saliphagus sp. GCM10025308]